MVYYLKITLLFLTFFLFLTIINSIFSYKIHIYPITFTKSSKGIKHLSIRLKQRITYLLIDELEDLLIYLLEPQLKTSTYKTLFIRYII